MIGVSVLDRLNPTTVFTDLGSPNPALRVLLALAWFFVMLALQAIVYREIFVWTCANVQSTSGRKVRFVGKASLWIWWTVASILSLFSVVGWAWVSAAFLRWVFRNIDADGYRLAFVGGGFALLWRSLIYATTFILILPIPWAVSWYLRWFVSNVRINPDSLRTESRFAPPAV